MSLSGSSYRAPLNASLATAPFGDLSLSLLARPTPSPYPKSSSNMSANNPSSTSARAWSVAKLTSLKFEGDADALAAYVDALVENNRDTENGDPVLLREQATTDLADFLGKDAAEVFVDALMKYLGRKEGDVEKEKFAAGPMKGMDGLKEEGAGIKGGREAEKKQSVISRLGDRPVEPGRGTMRERPRAYASPRGGRRERGDRDRLDRLDGRNRERNDSRPDRMDRDRLERERGEYRDQVAVRDRLGPASFHRGNKRAREPDDDRRSEREPLRRRSEGGERRGGEGRYAGSSGRGNGRKDDDKMVQGVPSPFGFPPPMMTPEMMMKFPPPPFPPGIMPPHHLIPPTPVMGRDRRGGIYNGNGNRENRDREGRGRGRGWEGRDNESRGREGRGNMQGVVAPRSGTFVGHEGKGGRGKYSVLAMRNVPEDKLKLPHILKFFEMYGTPDNVQLVTPDRAFIIYANRESALAAVKSVDAIMGNRHIKLGWATAMDYEIANLELTEDGVLKPRTNGRPKNDRRNEKSDRRGDHHKQENNGDDGGVKSADKKSEMTEVRAGAQAAAQAAAQVAAQELKEKRKKAAEEDLRKKRQAIAEARAKQEEEKASLQARKKQLVEDQKRLVTEAKAATEQSLKVELLQKAKTIEAELKQVVAGLNPNAVTARQSQTVEASPHGGHTNWAGRGRGRGGNTIAGERFKSFFVDNRPKTLQIMGATPGITVDVATNVFHETVGAERVGGFWLLRFANRRAAESALRARGPLKRGFGTGAMAQIIADNEGTKDSVVEPENSNEGKDSGASEDGNEVEQVVVGNGVGSQEEEGNAMVIDSDNTAAMPVPAPATVE